MQKIVVSSRETAVIFVLQSPVKIEQKINPNHSLGTEQIQQLHYCKIPLYLSNRNPSSRKTSGNKAL